MAELTAGWARRILRMAAWGVTAYVASWLVAGLLITDYDPFTQAISETFALGAPTATRVVVTVSLVVTGALLVAFGPALDRVAPGSGRGVMWLAMVSGVATMLVAAAPCTQGCPGFGTTPLDTLHVTFATIGYIALIATPIALAWRVRDHLPSVARWSLAVGVVAGLVFLVANTVDTGMQGLLQRTYNTLADLWYVAIGLVIGRSPNVSHHAAQP